MRKSRCNWWKNRRRTKKKMRKELMREKKPLLERVSSKFQTSEDELQETVEEILVEANKGDMLTLNTHHPPRSHEHLSLPTTFYEPPILSPTPTPPKTLKPNFCQSISKPFLKAPNSTLRAYEEMVQSMFKESPSSPIPISKGKVKKRVSKYKRDLFDWLILFQPNLIQEGKVIT